ncbi:hypothetical protein Y1Q_0019669 [Alligator mississippiensis]|uniref:Uncharacterized protein n=1 Tax=Alligator mississippiensis TaxID=8496 RepID=A0A151PEP2_ALLMI|nr:hypothetical protein Y1Q_0019669 [Alligator mississippiensis]
MELPPTRQELVINLVSLSASLASHSSLQVICHNPVLQGPRAFHWICCCAACLLPSLLCAIHKLPVPLEPQVNHPWSKLSGKLPR